MTKFLFFAGSARKNSFNKKLAKCAYYEALNQKAEATFIDLHNYPMPLYHGDEEDDKGLPENAKALKKIFIDHQGIFIAAPEYNSSLAPLLKNTLDWISRAEKKDEAPLAAYIGKTIALGSASPGGYGGIRGLVPLRMMLQNINCMTIPSQICIPAAMNAFNEKGGLQDEKHKNMLKNTISQLIETAKKLNL